MLADATNQTTSLTRSTVMMKIILLLLAFCTCSVSELNHPCCQFNHDKTCDVFEREDRSLCTLETRQSIGEDKCPNKRFPKWKDPDLVSELSVDHQLKSCYTNQTSETCMKRHGTDTLILQIGFRIGGPEIPGIFIYIKSDAEPYCYYIIINRKLTKGDIISTVAEDQKWFYFNGLEEELHPGSSYYVQIESLPSKKGEVKKNVTYYVPDCNKLQETVYFCTLPSYATWDPRIVVKTSPMKEGLHIIHVSFTMTTALTVENVDIQLHSEQHEVLFNEYINSTAVKALQKTVGNSAEYVVNVNLQLNLTATADIYTVTVQPNYGYDCIDRHWSLKRCPIWPTEFTVKDNETLPSTTIRMPLTVAVVTLQWPITRTVAIILGIFLFLIFGGLFVFMWIRCHQTVDNGTINTDSPLVMYEPKTLKTDDTLKSLDATEEVSNICYVRNTATDRCTGCNNNHSDHRGSVGNYGNFYGMDGQPVVHEMRPLMTEPLPVMHDEGYFDHQSHDDPGQEHVISQKTAQRQDSGISVRSYQEQDGVEDIDPSLQMFQMNLKPIHSSETLSSKETTI